MRFLKRVPVVIIVQKRGTFMGALLS